MDDRICEEEISGGNSPEATSRSLNSSSNKPTASFTDSAALASSDVLRFLTVRHLGGFADGRFSLSLEGVEVGFRTRLKPMAGIVEFRFIDGRFSPSLEGVEVGFRTRLKLKAGIIEFRNGGFADEEGLPLSLSAVKVSTEF